jgi:hypothetical protein
MLVGFFGCMLSLPSVGSWTMVGWGFLARGLTLFCILGLVLFPWRYYQRAIGINAFETFLFNVMGVGPLLFSLVLWANFLLRGPVEEEVLRIEERKFVGQMLNPVYRYELEGGAYASMPEFRRFKLDPSNKELLVKAQKVRYRTAEGLFGYRVMVGREPVR